MSDAYAIVHISKSLPIHWMGLTSTGRKIEHKKVVVDPKGTNQMAWFPWKSRDSAREPPTSGHQSVMMALEWC